MTFSDTHPEIERIQIQHLRQMSAAKKLVWVGEMNRTVRKLAMAGLRQRHPNYTPAQHKRMMADLLLGKELAEKVYGAINVD